MKKKNLFKVVLFALFMLPILALASCGNPVSRGYKLSSEATSEEQTPAATAEVSTAKEVISNWIDSIDFRTYSGISVLNGYEMDRLCNLLNSLIFGLNYTQDNRYEARVIEFFEYDAGNFEVSSDAYVDYYVLELYYLENDCFKILKNGNEELLTISFSDGTVDENDLSPLLPDFLSKEDIKSLYYTDCSCTFGSETEVITSDNSNWVALWQELTNIVFEVEYNGDAVAPDFDTENVYIPVSVDNPLSVNEILSQIHAYDDVDGDISDDIQLVSTTYDPNQLELGNHELIVSVSDSAGNNKQATFYITVYDITKPVISGTNTYKLSYDEPISIETVLAALTASDNFTQDLTIELKSDTYTENQAIVGKYTMVFTTTDEALNISEDYVVSFSVVDEKPAVITVPSQIIVNSTAVFSEAELRKKITIVDGYDGEITSYTITGLEEYLKDTTKVKNYTLGILAYDAAGNRSSASTTLKVSDNNAPELWVYSDFVIVLPKGQAITKEDIISYLSQIGEIDAAQVKSVSFDVDNETKGNYEVVVLMLDNTEYKATIAVEEYEEPFNFWEASWELYIQNWKDFSKWNYSHWLTLILAVFLVIGAIVANRKKRK